ncbi:traM protein [Legionella geestiana]|uniref:TraM protein n=1 Tax=Legionella geestiana TaxID=45065 RepID=A0A0W0U6Q7_9GAMM|nr:hypothetical protein [Legionella geestiana]KTD03715.1 traM protein [Legionella geestiana]QBS11518.1 conjugal transfer protein TraM [Legionella geestiana]STX53817.1 traM protein [Legionella geestiana]
MTDKLQEITQEIAKRHGVLVGRDDPILMLHTMNDMLMQENLAAQRNVLADFRTMIEEGIHRLEDGSSKKSEQILNVAILASKTLLQNAMQDGAESAMSFINQEIDKKSKAHLFALKKACTVAWVNLSVSGVVLIGTCILALLHSLNS